MNINYLLIYLFLISFLSFITHIVVNNKMNSNIELINYSKILLDIYEEKKLIISSIKLDIDNHQFDNDIFNKKHPIISDILKKNDILYYPFFEKMPSLENIKNFYLYDIKINKDQLIFEEKYIKLKIENYSNSLNLKEKNEIVGVEFFAYSFFISLIIFMLIPKNIMSINTFFFLIVPVIILLSILNIRENIKNIEKIYSDNDIQALRIYLKNKFL